MADTPTTVPPTTTFEGERDTNFFEWVQGMSGSGAPVRGSYRHFMESLGLTSAQWDRYNDADTVSAIENNPALRLSVMSDILQTKTADQILDGFQNAATRVSEGTSAYRENADNIYAFVNELRNNPEAKEAFATAIKSNPNAFDNAVNLFANRDGMSDRPFHSNDARSFYNTDQLIESIRTPEGLASFTAALAAPAANSGGLVAELNNNGIDVGANADLARESSARFLSTLTGQNLAFAWGPFANAEWNSVMQHPEGSPEQNQAIRDLIEIKGSGALLDSLQAASPTSEAMLNIIRQDTELAEAFHGAVVNDPTVLDGLAQLTGPGSAVGPDMIAQALADPQTRAGVITMLDKVAANEGADDDLTFADLSNALESGAAFASNPNAPGAADRYRNALARFGLQDNRIMMAQLMADPGAALMQMLQDPHTFFANIRMALGNIAPGGFVDSALNIVENGIASWTQDPQIHQFMDHYNVQAAFNEVSNVQANMGIVAAPSAPTPGAVAEAPAVEETVPPMQSTNETVTTVSAVTNFNEGLSQHAGTGVQVASADYGNIQIGEAGKGFARDGFNSPASGLVPTRQIEEFGTSLVASVKNDSMQFGLTG